MSTSLALQITSDHRLLILSIAAICIECFAIGFSLNFLRKKVFNRDFMKKNFEEIHKKEFGRGIGPMGYPDTGSGRYSDALSYKEWYEFNLAQRAHLNFAEQIGVILPLLLTAGVFYPVLAGYIGWIYFFGRLIYFLQYRSEGPKGRMIGAYTFFSCIIGLAVLTLYGALTKL
jgi:hypothetical protein